MQHNKTTYQDIHPYITRDGSEIRELMHPSTHGNRNQSLAEALIKPGQSTLLHRHHHTEELYFVVSGEGLMTLGDSTVAIKTGDTIHIAPGTSHKVQASASAPLRILCCCSPAYSHEDTELLEHA